MHTYHVGSNEKWEGLLNLNVQNYCDLQDKIFAIVTHNNLTLTTCTHPQYVV